MEIRTKTILSVIIVSLFLAASLTPIFSASADTEGENADICELTYGGQTKKFSTVTGAVNEWNTLGYGECVLTIYKDTVVEEQPIHIVQQIVPGMSNDRSLAIEGKSNVVMKCNSTTAVSSIYCIFYITAQSDFTQTPSITFRNITFDMTSLTKECCGIYSAGTGTERYIRGIFVDSCRFIGNTNGACVGVKTTANGSADFTLYNCMGEDLHSLFNGYCFKNKNETYGLNIISCTSTHGKYFVNNQAGEHTTLIKDCVADYYGSSDDSYGVRTGGSSLYMENVKLTYTGSYGSNFDAFVVVNKNHEVGVLSINNCAFRGFDDVTDSLTAGQNRKDVYVSTSTASVAKFVVDGEEKQLVSGKYYNFARYTASVDNQTGGTVTISDGHNKGTSVKAMKGAELILGCKTDDKYVFDSWTAPSTVSIDAINHFVMGGENITVTPAFRYTGTTTYDVFVSCGTGGEATQSTTVESGSDFTLIAKAYDNYRVSKVTVNGQDVGAVGMYTVKNITAAVTIEVSFESAPGTTTEISENYVTETTVTDGEIGMEAVSKITDRDANVINQTAISSYILDVVTTATTTDSERYEKLNNTIESKITVGSTVSEKTAEVTASEEYLEEADKQIEELKSRTSIDTDPVYNMNIHSDSEYTKISANFGSDIVKAIDDKSGLISISSSDEGKSSQSAVVLDRDVVGGLTSKDFSSMNLTVGISEKEELTEEQKAIVGDNPVVFAKMILTDSQGNKTNVSDLGGKATISIEHEFATEDPTFYVYYIAPDGTLEKMENATYDPYTKTVSFTTTHFSQFVIMEENIDPVIGNELPNIVCIIIAVAITLCCVYATYDYRFGKKD